MCKATHQPSRAHYWYAERPSCLPACLLVFVFGEEVSSKVAACCDTPRYRHTTVPVFSQTLHQPVQPLHCSVLLYDRYDSISGIPRPRDCPSSRFFIFSTYHCWGGRCPVSQLHVHKQIGAAVPLPTSAENTA